MNALGTTAAALAAAAVGLLAAGRPRRPAPRGRPEAGPAGARTRWTGRAGLRPRRDETERSVVRDLPELVDLLILAVEAGHPVAHALSRLGTSAPRVFADGFARYERCLSRGAGLEEALGALADAWGSPARGVVRAALDHARYGTPVVPALTRCAEEARATRRRAAETRARRLPVLLLFPLVTCTLPAFGLLTVAPMVVSTLGSLDVGPFEAESSPVP